MTARNFGEGLQNSAKQTLKAKRCFCIFDMSFLFQPTPWAKWLMGNPMYSSKFAYGMRNLATTFLVKQGANWVGGMFDHRNLTPGSLGYQIYHEGY